jgi:hypothetical protein
MWLNALSDLKSLNEIRSGGAHEMKIFPEKVLKYQLGRFGAVEWRWHPGCTFIR